MFRNLLFHWIICSDQPFTEVENSDLQYLFRFLKSEVNILSADTIKNDIIKIYKKEKNTIKRNITGILIIYFIIFL